MTPICIPSSIHYHWHGGTVLVAPCVNAQQEGDDAMPARRAIGISLAFMTISANAIAKAPENSTSDLSDELQGGNPGNAQTRFGKTPTFSCYAARDRRSDRHVGTLGEGTPDSYWEAARPIYRSQYGKAAWYGLVGNQTSSGEILDTVTATAAHRTLPLLSYAKVTNLDSGRSLIVKINDRGPFTPGRIIDLSPRAAAQLEMKQAGIVSVVVEPVEKGNEIGPQRPAPKNQAAAVRAAASEVREAHAEVGATKAPPAPAWIDPRIKAQ
jgi:rare lipoprotein A (peptidoglycan hydrolase)